MHTRKRWGFIPLFLTLWILAPAFSAHAIAFAQPDDDSLTCPQMLLEAADAPPLPAGEYLLREHNSPSFVGHEVLLITEVPESDNFIRRIYRRVVRAGKKSPVLEKQKPMGSRAHFAQIAPILKWVIPFYRDRRKWTESFIKRFWDRSWTYINDTIYTEVLHGPERRRVATMRFIVAPFSLEDGIRSPTGMSVRAYYGRDAFEFRDPEVKQPDSELPIPPRRLPVAAYLNLDFPLRTWNDLGVEIEAGANCLDDTLELELHGKAQALQWKTYLEIAFPNHTPLDTPPINPDSKDALIVNFKNSPDDWFALLAIMAHPQLKKELRRGGIVVEGFKTKTVANAVRNLLKSLGGPEIPVAIGFEYKEGETSAPNFKGENLLYSSGEGTRAFEELPEIFQEGNASAEELFASVASSVLENKGKANFIAFGEHLDFLRFRKAHPQWDKAWGVSALMGGGREKTGNSRLDPTRNWLPHQEELLPLLNDFLQVPGTTTGLLSSHQFAGSLSAIPPEYRQGMEPAPLSAFYDSLVNLGMTNPAIAAILNHWKNWNRAFAQIPQTAAGAAYNPEAPVTQLGVSPLAAQVLDKFIKMRNAEFLPAHERKSLADRINSPHTKALNSPNLLWFQRQETISDESLVGRMGVWLGDISMSQAAIAEDARVRREGPFGPKKQSVRSTSDFDPGGSEMFDFYGKTFYSLGDEKSISLNNQLGYEPAREFHQTGRWTKFEPEAAPPFFPRDDTNWYAFKQVPESTLAVAEKVARSRHRNRVPGTYFKQALAQPEVGSAPMGGRTLPAIDSILDALEADDETARQAIESISHLLVLQEEHVEMARRNAAVGDQVGAAKALQHFTNIHQHLLKVRARMKELSASDSTQVRLRVSLLLAILSEVSEGQQAFSNRTILTEFVPLLLIDKDPSVHRHAFNWVTQRYQLPEIILYTGATWAPIANNEALSKLKEQVIARLERAHVEERTGLTLDEISRTISAGISKTTYIAGPFQKRNGRWIELHMDDSRLKAAELLFFASDSDPQTATQLLLLSSLRTYLGEIDQD